MDSSIEFQIEIAPRGSHFIAKCNSFPDAIGAGATEDAAKQALIEVILVRLQAAPEKAQDRIPKKAEDASKEKHKFKNRLLPWMIATCAVTTAVWVAATAMVSNSSRRVTEPTPEADLQPGFVHEPQDIKVETKDKPVTIAPEKPTQSAIATQPEVVNRGEPTEKKPDISLKQTDYKELFREGRSKLIPSIAHLRRDAIRGVFAAQVEWANLLNTWGFEEESRAWARKLSAFVERQGVAEQVAFTELCEDLESLQPFWTVYGSQLQLVRPLTEMDLVQRLHEHAEKGSLEAQVGLARIYMKLGWDSTSDQAQKKNFDNLEWHWRRVSVDSIWVQGKIAEASTTLLEEWLYHARELNSHAGVDQAHLRKIVRKVTRTVAERTSPIISSACAAYLIDSSEDLVNDEDIDATEEFFRRLIRLADDPEIQSEALPRHRLFTELHGAHSFLSIRGLKTDNEKVVQRLSPLLGAIEAALEKCELVDPILTKIQSKSFTDDVVQAYMDRVDVELQKFPELREVQSQVKGGILKQLASESAGSIFSGEGDKELAVRLSLWAAEIGHEEALLENFSGIHQDLQIDPAKIQEDKSGKWRSGHPEMDRFIGLLFASAKSGHPFAQIAAASFLNQRAFTVIDRILPESERSEGTKFIDFVRTNSEYKRFRSEAKAWRIRAANQGNKYAQLEIDSESVYFTKSEDIKNAIEQYRWGLIAAQPPPSGPFDFYTLTPLGLDAELVPRKRLLEVYDNANPETIDLAGIEASARAFKPKLERPVHELELVLQAAGSGTGFMIGPDVLVTNAHVVGSWKEVRIETTDAHQSFSGRVVRLDESNDLAVVKLEAHKFPDWLKVAASTTIELGTQVYTIGFPNPDIQGKEPKYTNGTISSLAGISDDRRFFQITIPVQPGNSGGPLVDSEGNVVGVVTARLGDLATFRETGAFPQNVNYALKASYLVPLIEGMLEGVPARPPVGSQIERVKNCVVRVVTGGD